MLINFCFCVSCMWISQLDSIISTGFPLKKKTRQVRVQATESMFNGPLTQGKGTQNMSLKLVLTLLCFRFVESRSLGK